MPALATSPPLDAITSLQPSLNLVAVYTDEEAATVLFRWYLKEFVIPVSLATAQRVLARAQRDRLIEEREGYEDDPTAQIHWLQQNEYVLLLSENERRAVAGYQAVATPRPQRRSPVTGRYRR